MQLSNNFRLGEFTRSDTAKRLGIRRHMGRFGRLALLYYPDHGYKRAVHLFRQELRETRGLLQALQDVGYKGNERILTPRQVQVIEEFLGEP